MALLTRPFEFEFSLVDRGLSNTEVLDDPAFNRICKIRTPAPERTLAALSSAELRAMIASFLSAPNWTCRVTSREVTALVRDAHQGPESVRAALAAAVAIAYRFDQRG